jgi:hypothetical protein
VCNSGTGLVPTIDGRTHHFYHVGIYDALFVMQDAETKTLWNHITGDAMYGARVGRSLGPMANLLHMTVSQALKIDAGVRVAISDQPYTAGGRRLGTAVRAPIVGGTSANANRGGRRSPLDNPGARMQERFAATLGVEDARRPRMDIGLGIWTGRTARFYPVTRIRERGEAFIDRIDGRSVLVYIERESNTPAALYVEGNAVQRHGEGVRLDDGTRVEGGVLIDARGRASDPERPQQMFTRWYGFALTFPRCEVFGE